MTTSIDTLLTNALVLTMDKNLSLYEPGAVAVQDDSILAVGPEAELKQQYAARETVDCGGKVLM
ncbi:MAG: amidohydrolase, partial [Chloroflexi bacterium]|nr:amidohydrolase [Chloroflexota bacterium]